MIKIENVDVYGWEAAIRGMRNPMNSWDKSDSYHGCGEVLCGECRYDARCRTQFPSAHYEVGDNDLKLMKSLSQAGTDHSKFLRMINVTCDITAPLYWWKEFDTYKVGTVANSCSTMHKIHDKEFTLDDFSHEKLIKHEPIPGRIYSPLGMLNATIGNLNSFREMFLETNDKRWWEQMIQLLPSSYNQKRTVQLNYQVLKSMYFARKSHKLDEWRTFCEWVETLPYFKEIIL